MLRLKVNVGIKWVFTGRTGVPTFRRTFVAAAPQKKTLDETRRKLRTDLPTSQSQVIAFVCDIICILDLLSKMPSLLQALSSFHHITMPCGGWGGGRGRRAEDAVYTSTWRQQERTCCRLCRPRNESRDDSDVAVLAGGPLPRHNQQDL